MSTFDKPKDLGAGKTILMIDDQPDSRLRLEILLGHLVKHSGVNFLQSACLEDGLSILAKEQVNVVLLDKNLSADDSVNGIDHIAEILNLQKHVQVLVVTGSEETGDIVRAIKNGAFGYITKMSDDALIVAQIEQALKYSSLVRENINSDRLSRERVGIGLVGSSQIIQAIKRQIEAVAETDKPVLLVGETGTGKTTAAKLIHSYRENFLKQDERPFFSLNMGAQSPELIASELFGHEKGAFTDAKETKEGLVELAHNGTLFLDEIGEASGEVQKKLLTFIEEKKFRRIGGKRDLESSFKLICATNKDLEKMVEKGEFRKDLYFRISTFVVKLPPLRDRREDIPELIQALLPRCCEDNNVHISYDQLPESFIEYLVNYNLDGNIRGIEQQMARLLVFSRKDRRGIPNFKNWEKLPGLQNKRKYNSVPKQAITLKEIRARPFNVVDDDFPGLEDFLGEIEEKVYLEAKGKIPKNIDIAETFKTSSSTVSLKLKKYRKGASAKRFEPTT